MHTQKLGHFIEDCDNRQGRNAFMDLRHLRYVVATARNGSFSAAALELEFQQPIVSRRIRELEEELGVALFDRSTAGAKLASRLIEFHGQNKTVAASMIAEKKVSGHRSYRVATYEEDQKTVRGTVFPTIGQSFRRPNMISMRLRRL
ncbi:hypothetical protein AQY21_02550 [Paracoccus sp. MKU1]|nr:hypothetical protein AQY21_02550 [Paracoccus sp. MKU1]